MAAVRGVSGIDLDDVKETRLPAVLHCGEEGVGGDRTSVQQPGNVVDRSGGHGAEGWGVRPCGQSG